MNSGERYPLPSRLDGHDLLYKNMRDIVLRVQIVPGTGSVDFPALSTTLQDGGYSGPLLLEKVPGRKYRLRGIMCRVLVEHSLSMSPSCGHWLLLLLLGNVYAMLCYR